MGWVMGLLWFFTTLHVAGVVVLVWKQRRA